MRADTNFKGSDSRYPSGLIVILCLNISLLKIAGQNRIFSLLRIEAKLIENLLPLGLEDVELHFNKRLEQSW